MRGSKLGKSIASIFGSLIVFVFLVGCGTVKDQVEKKIDDKVESVSKKIEEENKESSTGKVTTDSESEETSTTKKNSTKQTKESDQEELTPDEVAAAVEAGDCTAIAIQYFSFFSAPYALMAGASQDEIDEFEAQAEKLRKSVPEDIRDDFEILAEAYEEFAKELQAVVEDGELSVGDLDNIQKIARASEKLDTPEVRAAQDKVDTYFDSCQLAEGYEGE